MATRAEKSYTERATTYLRRARWLHALLLVEIFFIGGGYWVAQQGTNATTLGSPVDLHKALGGIMGAMAIVFAGIVLFFVSVSVLMRFRRYRQEKELQY